MELQTSPAASEGSIMTDHYDVIVIGSGAGGGTLTHALAPTGKRILLLERGDFLPREPQNWDSKSVWVDLRYHNSGNWTDASSGEQFQPKQNYYVGGNTKVYGAILFRFRERDFRQIQHVDGVSPAWPLSYADFEPWYTRAEHLYHVHGQRGADPGEPPSAAPYRYPPLSHEPRIAQLEADFTTAGLHPFPLPVGLIYDESAPQFSPCIRCATCDGYPCLVNGNAEDPADLARHSMDFWLTTEDLPLPGNQVLLGRDRRIRLRYIQTNAEAHRRLRGKFEGLLDAIQCRDTVLPGYHYLGGRLGINAVAHQNGTVRFGTDPAASALDLNCKMHDLDNLYVVDSSFFVSSTAVNPTLTIIANALRVADHIAGRLGAAGQQQARPEPVTAHA
jgi:choline dehydrogenase-like flavoprotein